MQVAEMFRLVLQMFWTWLLRWFYDRQTWYRTYYLQCLYWKRFIKWRRKLADYECEKCGSTDRPLDVHHPRWAYNFLFFEWVWPYMTQVLCRTCHDEVHALKK